MLLSEAVGRMLRVRRLFNGLSLSEVARRLGTSRGAVRRVESGYSPESFKSVLIHMRAVGLDRRSLVAALDAYALR